MASIVENDGKKLLLDESIGPETTLRFEATYSVDGGANQTMTETVTYGTATIDGVNDNATIDITADVTFVFPDDDTVVSQVSLQYIDLIAYDIVTETLTTENSFPFGGSLIIKEYKITIN